MWTGFALIAYGVRTWSAQTAKVAHNKAAKEASFGFVPSFGKMTLLVWTQGLAVAAVFALMFDIFNHPPDGMELYMMSAVWLLIGIGLLVFGLKTKNRNIRLVSGGVIIVTVLKAFLIDMANLEGVLRAMSFVILGLVLIVIGRVYQKLIFANKPAQGEM